MICFATTALSSALAAEGDAARGQRVFGACVPCHSLEPDENKTSPSLNAGGNQQLRCAQMLRNRRND